MLQPYRVIDLTDERGQLAGMLLAWLGAEVIAVEPPGGARTRRIGPWAGDRPGPEASLTHAAYNRGKSSVVLDLTRATDRERFLDLVATSDVLLESSTPGDLERLGLSTSTLAGRNPALVHVSITPFGTDGPKAAWAATDLTVWAAAGPLAMTGDADRPPIQIGVPQAFHHAATEAAGAAVAALIERSRSGLGQHVDVSAQQAAMQATQSAILAAPAGATPTQRAAGGVRFGPIELQMTWPCADGHVSITFLFGPVMGPATQRLMRFVCERGHCDRALAERDWIGFGGVLQRQTRAAIPIYQEAAAAIGRLCSSATKAELFDAAMERGLLIAPVKTIADVVQWDQFVERGAFDDVDGVVHPGRPFVRHPDPLTALSAPPALNRDAAHISRTLDRRPAIGTHSPPLSSRAADGPSALSGLRVLDLMWVMAGPAASRTLADLGATVIRVESRQRIDAARTIGPFHGNRPHPEASVLFANLNAGKLGVAIDLSSPHARDLVHDLVRWADVVLESFAPGVIDRLGYGYEALRRIKPDLVMASSSLLGRTGPAHTLAGYGTMAAALSGFFAITGWPDRDPAGPAGAYTDYLAPRILTAGVLAAVDHRRRTGEGSYLDLAQAEACLAALGPAILDLTVNGRVRTARGNDDPDHAPHGVYQSAGDDRWVAIACRDDDQRAALAAVTGGLEHDDIERWTRTRTPEEATAILQRVRVPAHPVLTTAEAMADEQLRHRRHFRRVPHAHVGAMVIEGPRVQLSRTPADVRRAGPTLGEDADRILKEILGYDDQRVSELVRQGVLG